MRSRNPIAWCAIDTLCCLLLVIYVLVAPPPKKHTPPSIPTFGQYAIIMTWPGNRKDDIDLHVQDPQGEDVYWQSDTTRDMHLEHDNIPEQDVSEHAHHERTVIRGVEVGEYVVNAHFYGQRSPGPCPVAITLYRLRGNDGEVMSEQFILSRQGDEHTAFRFTLNRAGNISETNHLQRRLVQ